MVGCGSPRASLFFAWGLFPFRPFFVALFFLWVWVWASFSLFFWVLVFFSSGCSRSPLGFAFSLFSFSAWAALVFLVVCLFFLFVCPRVFVPPGPGGPPGGGGPGPRRSVPPGGGVPLGPGGRGRRGGGGVPGSRRSGPPGGGGSLPRAALGRSWGGSRGSFFCCVSFAVALFSMVCVLLRCFWPCRPSPCLVGWLGVGVVGLWLLVLVGALLPCSWCPWAWVLVLLGPGCGRLVWRLGRDRCGSGGGGAGVGTGGWVGSGTGWLGAAVSLLSFGAGRLIVSMPRPAWRSALDPDPGLRVGLLAGRLWLGLCLAALLLVVGWVGLLVLAWLSGWLAGWLLSPLSLPALVPVCPPCVSPLSCSGRSVPALLRLLAFLSFRGVRPWAPLPFLRVFCFLVSVGSGLGSGSGAPALAGGCF